MLIGLLFATAAAFAITEHLKLEQAPIHGTLISRYLSPDCHCASSKATIAFKLRHPDRVTVRIVDARTHTVATLAQRRPEPKGQVTFSWRGRTDAGLGAPDGRYEAEIHLTHWAIVVPDPIILDTKPPLVRSVTAAPATISPGGTGPDNHLRIRYRLSEQAHAIVWHGPHRLLRTRDTRPDDKTTWDGRTAHVAWKPGTYTLTVGAVDLAGNVTPPARRKRIVVTIRYVTFLRKRISVQSGKRFAVGVEAFGTYTWTFDRRHGTSHRSPLRLRAPAKSGRYRIVATEAGHTASALVVVR